MYGFIFKCEKVGYFRRASALYLYECVRERKGEAKVTRNIFLGLAPTQVSKIHFSFKK